MRTELERDIETLKSDLAKFREDLGATLSDVGSYSQEKVKETRERLNTAMEDFGSRTHQGIRQVNTKICERGQKVVKASREATARRPLTTMAISFGAGALAAATLLKRHNHE